MRIEKSLTSALIVMLVGFGALNVFGVQPGEDNNRWLLYLFVLAWPLLSVAAFVGGLVAVRHRPTTAIVALVASIASLVGFATWGRVYAGLW